MLQASPQWLRGGHRLRQDGRRQKEQERCGSGRFEKHRIHSPSRHAASLLGVGQGLPVPDFIAEAIVDCSIGKTIVKMGPVHMLPEVPATGAPGKR